MSETNVTNNVGQSQYEVVVGGDVVGFAAYKKEGKSIAFTSTRVLPSHQNLGLAAQMANAALLDAQREGLTVDPACSYFAVYIRRHPEFADLVNT